MKDGWLRQFWSLVVLVSPVFYAFSLLLSWIWLCMSHDIQYVLWPHSNKTWSKYSILCIKKTSINKSFLKSIYQTVKLPKQARSTVLVHLVMFLRWKNLLFVLWARKQGLGEIALLRAKLSKLFRNEHVILQIWKTTVIWAEHTCFSPYTDCFF